MNKKKAIKSLEEMIEDIKNDKIDAFIAMSHSKETTTVKAFGDTIIRAGLVSELQYETNKSFDKMNAGNMLTDLFGGLGDD